MSAADKTESLPSDFTHKRPAIKTELYEAKGKHIYSEVHKEAPPAVPPKSSDLQVYLATQVTATQPGAVNPSSQPSPSLPPVLAVGMSDNPYDQSTPNEMDSALYAQPYFPTTQPTASADNDCIYSEPINPSDFTRK